MTDIRSWHDFEDDKFVFGRTQDVESYLDANKAAQNEQQKGDFRLIASIPVVILERWIIEDGVNYLAVDKLEFSRLVRRKLRDPDWKWLRTSSGNI
jgi:hypothetical protein